MNQPNFRITLVLEYDPGDAHTECISFVEYLRIDTSDTSDTPRDPHDHVEYDDVRDAYRRLVGACHAINLD